MVTQRIALNTATGATLADRAITFAGADVSAPVINFLDNQAANCIKKVYAAEVLGVKTVTFTEGNNTTYSFVVKQVIGNNIVEVPFSYTTDASGTVAEIQTAFSEALSILIGSGALKVAATYSNPTATTFRITLTALAGYPLVDIIAGQNATAAITTAGARAVNNGVDLVAEGVENAVSGNTYTSFEFVTADMSFSAGQERKVWKKLIVYIKTGETAIAQLTSILNADAFASGQVELLS